MFILYDCVLPHTQDFRPRLCPAALEKTQSENWEEFFIIPYHHDVTGSFGSSNVLLDGKSPQICMFLVLQLTQWQYCERQPIHGIVTLEYGRCNII